MVSYRGSPPKDSPRLILNLGYYDRSTTKLTYAWYNISLVHVARVIPPRGSVLHTLCYQWSIVPPTNKILYATLDRYWYLFQGTTAGNKTPIVSNSFMLLSYYVIVCNLYAVVDTHTINRIISSSYLIHLWLLFDGTSLGSCVLFKQFLRLYILHDIISYEFFWFSSKWDVFEESDSDSVPNVIEL